MQDCTYTTSGLIFMRVQFSNYFLLNSCILPSRYLTVQKGSFSFILCSSIDCINNFLSLCSTYFINLVLFECRRSFPQPSVKQDGRICSMYFSWTNQGLISLRRDFWNFYYSISLYCFFRRSMVVQRDFVGNVPSIFFIRLSFMSVWKTLRESPSIQQISGMQILRLRVSRQHSPLKIVRSQASESVELCSKPGGFSLCPYFLLDPQTKHQQFWCPHNSCQKLTVSYNRLSPWTIFPYSGVSIVLLVFLLLIKLNNFIAQLCTKLVQEIIIIKFAVGVESMELNTNRLNLINRGAGSWQTVVLKMVHSGSKESKHLHNEYAILKKLLHEHIITPFKYKKNVCVDGLAGAKGVQGEQAMGAEGESGDVGACRGVTDILVLEHAEKGSLMKVMKEKKLSVGQIRGLFQQICEAVEYLHCNYIVHRDLKLENIFVCVQNSRLVCKLGDFGFATSCSSAQGFILFNSYKGTKRGYMAPQIHSVLNEPEKYYDGRKADIFALGVILFAMVLGRLPFEYATMQNNLYKLIAQEKYEQFWAQHALSLRKLQEKEYALADDFKELFISMVRYDANCRVSMEDVLDFQWFNGKKEDVQA